jgi:putrescine importer
MSVTSDSPSRLRRALGLWDLILYGIVVIQPTAPMPVFGVVSQRAQGHVVTAILIAMFAMLCTAFSYGRMASAYPSAGSAFTYVGQELHPALGYVTGWGMLMDYLLNPLICTILCAQLARNLAPGVPYAAWAIFFAAVFTSLNLFGIQTSAKINSTLAVCMGIVIAVFFVVAARYVYGHSHAEPGFFSRPFYDPAVFQWKSVLGGTSLAVLTYIGFDGISTLSEEARSPQRDILRATVLVCLVTGILAALEVYAAQLVWPAGRAFPEVDTAFVHVAGLAGGPWLLQLVNITLLVATVGSGIGSQLGAARLLYAMGRSNAIPARFFGKIEPKHRIPRNNVIFSGVFALAGAFVLSYERGVDLLNFGALIAFVGVNVACLMHYFFRSQERRWGNLLVPVVGSVVCALLWWNLNSRAKLLGTVWMLVGVGYGAFRTKGFRDELVNFGVPAETAQEDFRK